MLVGEYNNCKQILVNALPLIHNILNTYSKETAYLSFLEWTSLIMKYKFDDENLPLTTLQEIFVYIARPSLVGDVYKLFLAGVRPFFLPIAPHICLFSGHARAENHVEIRCEKCNKIRNG